MKQITNESWIYYVDDEIPHYDSEKCGKWMYFFRDFDPSNLCKKAIQEHIVKECKHSNYYEGVCCFYLEDDDYDTHKKVIRFFLENNLIRRTKAGSLYNISFKHDVDTINGKYGNEFESDITLDKFLDLKTGKWLSAPGREKTYDDYLSEVRYDYNNLKDVPIDYRDDRMCIEAIWFHPNWVGCPQKRKTSFTYLNKKEMDEFISLIPTTSYSYDLCRQMALELNEKALDYIPRAALTNDVLFAMVDNDYHTVIYIPKELRTDELMERLKQIRGVKTMLKKEKLTGLM